MDLKVTYISENVKDASLFTSEFHYEVTDILKTHINIIKQLIVLRVNSRWLFDY